MSNYKELYDKWLNSPALTEEEKLQLKSVENDEVDRAVDRIKAIITSEHLKRERIEMKYRRALLELEEM